MGNPPLTSSVAQFDRANALALVSFFGRTQCRDRDCDVAKMGLHLSSHSGCATTAWIWLAPSQPLRPAASKIRLVISFGCEIRDR